MAKIELTRSPFIKTALKSRYPQLAVFIVMLVGYVFAILSGLVGTSVGSHNFSIVFVWIAWWAILILIAVPCFGRGWCAVCAIPLPGECILLAPGFIQQRPAHHALYHIHRAGSHAICGHRAEHGIRTAFVLPLSVSGRWIH